MRLSTTRGIGSWRVLGVGVVFVSLAASVNAQTLKTLWDTPDDLMRWMAVPYGVPQGAATRVERRNDGGRDFLRVRYGPSSQTEVTPVIAFPGGNWQVSGFNLNKLTALPTLMDPKAHNAVRITLRHQLAGLELLTGTWAHRDYENDESFEKMAAFEFYSTPDDGQWQDVTLKLSDSISLEPTVDIVYMELALVGQSLLSWKDIGKTYTTPGYIDIDKIEFVKIDESIPTPVITDFNPKRGRCEVR